MTTEAEQPDELTPIRQKLAAIEHERWADWQAWCHKILRENCPSPELEKVLERWDKQIATPYDQLSEAEKASDMEQVGRYWPLILALIAEREVGARRQTAHALLDVMDANSDGELKVLRWIEANKDTLSGTATQ